MDKFYNQAFHTTLQNNTEENRFAITLADGFREKPKLFRKSLGTIPFRKMGIEKANTTQLIPRRNSMQKTARK